MTLVDLLRPGVKLAGRKELSKHFVPELFNIEAKAVQKTWFKVCLLFTYLGLFGSLGI